MQSRQTNPRRVPAGLILGPLLFSGSANDGTIAGADLWLALIFRQHRFHLQSSSKLFNPANEFAVSAKKGLQRTSPDNKKWEESSTASILTPESSLKPLSGHVLGFLHLNNICELITEHSFRISESVNAEGRRMLNCSRMFQESKLI